MAKRVRVIFITDGDRIAQQVVEDLAAEMGLRCISASAGNPTPINGDKIVKLLQEIPRDPVLIMFDDKGRPGKGDGELAMEYLAHHPDVEVIGAVAVASNSFDFQGVHVDFCVDKDGVITDHSVNKNGDRMIAGKAQHPVVRGDTVDVLNQIDLPMIVGIGDIGKMHRQDAICFGAPVTKRAIWEILKRYESDGR